MVLQLLPEDEPLHAVIVGQQRHLGECKVKVEKKLDELEKRGIDRQASVTAKFTAETAELKQKSLSESDVSGESAIERQWSKQCSKFIYTCMYMFLHIFTFLEHC